MKLHVVVLALVVGASSSFAQGSLNPPGAPGQTMKSLDQIESRTVIPGGTTGYIISAPGSYVLGGNLTIGAGYAIRINTDNVTLDLNGFTIASEPTMVSGMGVSIGGGASNIRIFNGHIAGNTTYSFATHTFTPAGFETGISTSGSSRNVEIDHVTVGGTRGDGISAYDALIHHCMMNTCGGRGIFGGRVSDCQVRYAGTVGIEAEVVSGCQSTSVGQDGESHAISATVVNDSIGNAVTGSGIYAVRLAQNCQGFSDSGTGIFGDMVNTSYGISITGTGIRGLSVSNSFGSGGSGTAIDASHSAIGCFKGGGAVVSPNKLLGTP